MPGEQLKGKCPINGALCPGDSSCLCFREWITGQPMCVLEHANMIFKEAATGLIKENISKLKSITDLLGIFKK